MVTRQEIEGNLETAGTRLESAYDQMRTAVQDEGRMTEEVEDYFDSMEDRISDELEEFETNLYSAFEEVQSSDTDIEDSTGYMEDAGQSLVNAYHVSNKLFDNAEGVLTSGDYDFESGSTHISLDDETENMGEYSDSVAEKERAFSNYQTTLDNVARELVDQVQEQGMIMHLDVGLEQQQPDVNYD